MDPLVVFGALLRDCIGDEEIEDRRRARKAEVAFFGLGVMSSMLTSYLLLQFGVVV